jgi:C4-dicarboxylate-specific signal transduction histidine kinase
MDKIKSKEILFFGKITAGITHEIKNVLAIIQESSGLMEDILAITPDETFPRKDKFQTSLKRIFGQIDRGVDITTRLNKFAHSPDQSPADVDLNEVSEQMVLLASRFARLKNVVLEADPHDAPMIINTHPVALEMALFESIEILLNAISPGGKIRLYPRKVQDKYVFGVCCDKTIPPPTDVSPAISSSGRWESLQETMAYLSGTAKAFDSDLEILLYFPPSINA